MSDTQLANIKMPPHSVEAEQSVLGGLLLDKTSWDDVIDRVQAEDFYKSEHKFIFQVIKELSHDDKPLDAVTVGEALDNRSQLESAGGMSYLIELANNTPSASNILAYADIVKERAILRRLIQVANRIADTAYFPEGRKSSDILDQAESEVFEIAEQGSKGTGPQKVQDVVVSVMNNIEALYESSDPLTGVSTGFGKLDEMTSGLQDGDLVIVAGRPSMGKTTFAMNLAENVLMKSDLPVLVFSMEMPAESIVMRMISSLGMVDQTEVRSGKLSDDSWPKVMSAMGMLNDSKLLIDDSPALSPNEIRSRARRAARDHNGKLGLIMVDYLQLMQVPGQGNRVEEISEISRNLKALAKEMMVPVVALSQLNRGLEQRPDKRPVMSDLRESGAIEQDADVIMFIYRDEVYHPDNTEKAGIAEIIISKQRNGPIGRCVLGFQGRFTRFVNLASTQYDNYEDVVGE
jgi:replicative DNA helicase